MNNYRVRFAVPLTLSQTSPKRDNGTIEGSQIPRDLVRPQSSDGCCNYEFNRKSSLVACQPYCRTRNCCRLDSQRHRPKIESSSILEEGEPTPERQRIAQDIVRHADLSVSENDKILRHWFQNTCHIMVVDPSEDNPFSYSIITYLSLSKSLLHILKSLSLAHQCYFKYGQLVQSLEERGRAIAACRKELSSCHQTTFHLFFMTVYMLGLLASYMPDDVMDFGKEHLSAGRAIMDMILSDAVLRTNPLTRIVFGAFIHWDMSCAFLVDPSEQRPINTPLIYSFLPEMSHSVHPVTGLSTNIFYLLCVLGRYARANLEDKLHDVSFESMLMREFLDWRPYRADPLWQRTGEAFRKHGIIILCRLCCRSSPSPDCPESGLEQNIRLETTSERRGTFSHYLALDIVSSLLEVPSTSPHVALQVGPLLSAGGELAYEDKNKRSQIRTRLMDIYNFNRIPASLLASQLLEELWQLLDQGVNITWLELMLQKNCRIRI